MFCRLSLDAVRATLDRCRKRLSRPAIYSVFGRPRPPTAAFRSAVCQQLRNKARLARDFGFGFSDISEPADGLVQLAFAGGEKVSLAGRAAKLKSGPPLPHESKMCGTTVLTRVLAHERPRRQVAWRTWLSTTSVPTVARSL